MVYLHTGPMGVHCACFFIARAGRAATPERNRSGNQPPILCILPLVAHQLASARKNPFPDRPDYQPNRAPKRPHATVNKFRILKAKPLREPPMHRSASTGTVEIIRVGPDELEHWVDVVLRCFFEEPESPPPSLREGAIAMSMVPGTTSWLARVDGQPAGGGLLMIHDGLALICGDGTLPRYRHRGIQTLLLQGRLAHAAASGCELAAICTQPGSGSQRNAERQGFQVVYARTMLIHH